MRFVHQPIVVSTLAGVWAAAVVGGMWWLATYEHTPAVAAAATSEWPEGTPLSLGTTPTAVFFVHPHCPCTTSSANELARALTRVHGNATVYALVFRPESEEPGWTETMVVDAVRRVPGVRVVDDINGSEAERFGARVSGEVFLYGPDGALRYQGGVTGSRAHEGDNTARARFEQHIKQNGLATERMPVFGCSLTHPGGEEPSQ